MSFASSGYYHINGVYKLPSDTETYDQWITQVWLSDCIIVCTPIRARLMIQLAECCMPLPCHQELTIKPTYIMVWLIDWLFGWLHHSIKCFHVHTIDCEHLCGHFIKNICPSTPSSISTYKKDQHEATLFILISRSIIN